MDSLLLTDFTGGSPDLGWYIQNDNVMGGKSEGGFQISPSELIFSGNTNTNGGGFSSIRSNPLELDLSGYSGIRVKVEADGRRSKQVPDGDGEKSTTGRISTPHQMR